MARSIRRVASPPRPGRDRRRPGGLVVAPGARLGEARPSDRREIRGGPVDSSGPRRGRRAAGAGGIARRRLDVGGRAQAGDAADGVVALRRRPAGRAQVRRPVVRPLGLDGPHRGRPPRTTGDPGGRLPADRGTAGRPAVRGASRPGSAPAAPRRRRGGQGRELRPGPVVPTRPPTSTRSGTRTSWSRAGRQRRWAGRARRAEEHRTHPARSPSRRVWGGRRGQPSSSGSQTRSRPGAT